MGLTQLYSPWKSLVCFVTPDTFHSPFIMFCWCCMLPDNTFSLNFLCTFHCMYNRTSKPQGHCLVNSFDLFLHKNYLQYFRWSEGSFWPTFWLHELILYRYSESTVIFWYSWSYSFSIFLYYILIFARQVLKEWFTVFIFDKHVS